MTALRRAVDHGYRALDVLRTDPCLDALRGRDDFKTVRLDLQFPAGFCRW